MEYDFSGWASKNNLLCADGRIIRKDAFRDNNGKTVPLVYQHNHRSINQVLGHARLINKEDGVWADCKFNNSESGKAAKEAVKNGDIVAMSVWANNLVQVGKDVVHGVIREVSLVLSGANPGAFIESVVAHGLPMDDDDDEGIIYSGDDIIISHSEKDSKEEKKEDNKDSEKDSKEEKKEDNKDSEKDSKEEKKEEDDETVGEILDTLTEKQKKAVAIVISQITEDENEKDEEGDDDMKHHIFENRANEENTKMITSEYISSIISDGKRLGSLKESVLNHMENDENGEYLAHAIDKSGMVTATGTSTYGFNDPNMLFPDYKSLNNHPEWISRRMDWVNKVMTQVRRTPFSRIKSVYADITEDEARAKGYIKGNLKKEEVFTILKRTTDPQTIYKKQKMDRDDIIDITDFDVVAWIKAEMRVMLDEEIARAILIGDGRPSDSDDKIKEDHVRPIAKDVPLFNTIVVVERSTDSSEQSKNIIDQVIRARKNYKGSGKPTFWTTEDVLTEMLLIEDKVGHKLYKSEEELATTLRVSEIVTVEPMEDHEINGNMLIGLIVNLIDYNVGADKGGQVSMFEDFDIDYNQQKYLIETRISGALNKPFSAITIVLKGTEREASYSARITSSKFQNER